MRKVSNVIIVEGPTDAALVNTILHCIVEVTGVLMFHVKL